MSTGIQWTDETWNPIAAFDRDTGKRGWYCARVSPGCEHCYAATMNRFRGNGRDYSAQNAKHVECRIVEKTLMDPIKWRKPRRVFVCSMTDLFLDEHTDEMIMRVFSVMAEAERHIFQVLTKRPERMLRWFTEYLPEACSGEQPAPVWPLPNVWLGVTVEDQRRADERIPLLLEAPAAVRFLSCEPMLSAVDLSPYLPIETIGGVELERWLDWVIVGGESGRGARRFNLAWARSIVSQCRTSGTAIFVKQLGRSPVELTNGVVTWPEFDLKDSHGGDMAEWPEDLRVREFPEMAEAGA